MRARQGRTALAGSVKCEDEADAEAEALKQATKEVAAKASSAAL
jgi:hypothetical protein